MAGTSAGPEDPTAPLRIAILDSWPRDPATGSGTATGVAALVRGLEALGHRVRRLGPDGVGSLVGRLRWNVGLRRGLPGGPYDLVVGVDWDGCLREPSRGPPYAVALKGIRADEARFESGIPRLRLSLLSQLEALNAGRARTVVVPSDYSRRVAVRAYRVDPERVAVVPEAIDLAGWHGAGEAEGNGTASAPPGASDDGPGNDPDPGGVAGPHEGAVFPTVLSVARQYPRKNTRTLLAAFRRVADVRPRARLRVVGGGPELPALEGAVEELGLSGSVRLDGEVGAGALRDAYAGADVFALPSLQEGFGIVFLEAMAAGLPVVGSTAGAVPEVVVHGETGLVVDPRDADALADALLRLLDDPGLRRRLGEAGRRIVDRYDAPTVAERFLEAVAG